MGVVRMSAVALRQAASRPRLGFVGTGWIGQARLKAVADAGTAEIGAICEPNPASAQGALATAGDAVLVEDFGALLATRPDGIVIATPNALHAEQAQKALAAGCAVFCQKPLARNADEARAVVDAARAADRLLGLDLSYRHTRAMREIRQRIRAGAIGSIHAVDLTFHNAYGPDKPWFYDRALSGGGCVADLGVHLIDLLLWCLEDATVETVHAELFSGGRRLEPGSAEVEDLAFATLSLADGTVARLTCSWNLHAGTDAEIAATFHGESGSLAFRNVSGSFYDFEARHCQRTAYETIAAPPDDWGGGAILAWVERLARDPGFDQQAEDYVRAAEILDSIYRGG